MKITTGLVLVVYSTVLIILSETVTSSVVPHVGGYLLTDSEAPNVDGHHPWPASHDFHPRNGENVLLEDSINSEDISMAPKRLALGNMAYGLEHMARLRRGGDHKFGIVMGGDMARLRRAAMSMGGGDMARLRRAAMSIDGGDMARLRRAAMSMGGGDMARLRRAAMAMGAGDMARLRRAAIRMGGDMARL